MSVIHRQSVTSNTCKVRSFVAMARNACGPCLYRGERERGRKCMGVCTYVAIVCVYFNNQRIKSLTQRQCMRENVCMYVCVDIFHFIGVRESHTHNTRLKLLLSNIKSDIL